MMKHENYWNRFLGSGAIDDYLRYREVLETSEELSYFGSENGGKDRVGVKPDAGFCNSYRNSHQDRTRRGV